MLRNTGLSASLLSQPSGWLDKIRQAERELTDLLPSGAIVIVVDDDQVRSDLELPARVLPFLEQDGQYWGSPADDHSAVTELERLRQDGATYIAFLWPAFWWLDHYPRLSRVLHRDHRCVLRSEQVVAFELRPSAEDEACQACSSEHPNDAAAWERIYLTPLSPVTELSSPVARAVADLTSPGEVLLEAGCGSAVVSAELATTGRTIALCDFSQALLARAVELFSLSELPTARAVCCDLTKPLPWSNGSVDVVWSSGVLEHWTDEELVPILSEMARISRRAVISFVPYSGCMFYRLGKYLAEETRQWPYGREIPRSTLKPTFRAAGLSGIREFNIWPEAGLTFLGLSDFRLHRLVEEWWSTLDADDATRNGQGYLLVTVGYVGNGA
jgi:2-polyprenyl-3-methyl-5-hydroxy-6-metoxy-1,4-benzoquinol methylase